MGWFRRKKKDEPIVEDTWRMPPTPPEAIRTRPIPTPAPEPESGVSFGPNGSVSINVSSIPAAKLAVKQLKLRKKELAVEKKAVAAEMAQLRAERRMEVARQGSMTRGGGNLGKTIRTFERISRDNAKARHANALAPYEQRKAELDMAMLNIDSGVAQLEGYILQNSET